MRDGEVENEFLGMFLYLGRLRVEQRSRYGDEVEDSMGVVLELWQSGARTAREMRMRGGRGDRISGSCCEGLFCVGGISE